jgi:hypothetical protein
MILAETNTSDAVTIGLGIIAGALFFGEFAFFKWIHGPAITRADKQLADAEERHKEEMAMQRVLLVSVEERHKEELATQRAQYQALELKTDRYYSVLEDKALPALTTATMTVSQFQSLIAEMKQEQDRQSKEREIEEAVKRGAKTA